MILLKVTAPGWEIAIQGILLFCFLLFILDCLSDFIRGIGNAIAWSASHVAPRRTTTINEIVEYDGPARRGDPLAPDDNYAAYTEAHEVIKGIGRRL